MQAMEKYTRTSLTTVWKPSWQGHIMQPAYTRHFNPGIKDEDIMPATLSPELIEGLLRGKLGFNGMVLTDASHMVGLTCCMKRSEMLPHTIAAGVDMFLFSMRWMRILQA